MIPSWPGSSTRAPRAASAAASKSSKTRSLCSRMPARCHCLALLRTAAEVGHRPHPAGGHPGQDRRRVGRGHRHVETRRSRRAPSGRGRSGLRRCRARPRSGAPRCRQRSGRSPAGSGPRCRRRAHRGGPPPETPSPRRRSPPDVPGGRRGVASRYGRGVVGEADPHLAGLVPPAGDVGAARCRAGPPVRRNRSPVRRHGCRPPRRAWRLRTTTRHHRRGRRPRARRRRDPRPDDLAATPPGRPGSGSQARGGARGASRSVSSHSRPSAVEVGPGLGVDADGTGRQSSAAAGRRPAHGRRHGSQVHVVAGRGAEADA